MIAAAINAGSDPSPLAVLSDVLQEKGAPLGQAIARVLLDPRKEMHYLGLECFQCEQVFAAEQKTPLRFHLPVFCFAPFARALALPAGQRAAEAEFVLLPPIDGHATFTMGGTSWSHEQPYHQVTIAPFLVGRTTVTRGVFRWLGPFDPNDQAQGGPADDPRLPASVSWNALCHQTGFLAHTQLRLPTESEWEYACRGGSAGEYCFGDDQRLLERYAWLGWSQPKQPVAQRLANAYGLFDVHGNVKEWCQDRWHTSYKDAPTNGESWNTGRSPRRVLRGGSRNSIAASVRCAAREAAKPDRKSTAIGFRPARTP